MEDLKTITVRMMTSDHDWPHLGLPVKLYHEDRPGEFPTMGYLLDPAVGGQGPVTIYIGNLFNVKPGEDQPIHFKDVAAAVNAGWRVD